jgi:hypothetical protein
MSAQIFEFAVLWHPTKKQIEDAEGTPPKSKIVVEITQVLAKDDAEVNIIASRAIPDEYLDQLEQVELVVRPF